MLLAWIAVVVTFSMITVVMFTEVSKLSVGNVTFAGPGVAVGDAVGAGEAVGGAVGVAVGAAVGVAVGAAVGPAIVIDPLV